MNRLIDFRSDTVTQPDEGMREAMARAELGDDVYGDDPSVNRLEESFASMIGKDASVFFPSGTQSNLAAILTHCGRGDELLVGREYHTYSTEAGGASAMGGVVYCPLPTSSDCSIEPDLIDANVKADDPHFPCTRLLSLENTVSGLTIPLHRIAAVASRARMHGLAVHLDGARLFNAAIELGTDIATLAGPADTVSVCLSKGLGAPVGTMLSCSTEHLPRVRRFRKILGGGMRQTGVLAAAGLYALDHNIRRLGEDHRRARKLAGMLERLNEDHGVDVTCQTNMVFLKPDVADHALLRAHLAESGMLVTRKKPVMRFVVHLGIDDSDVQQFGEAILEFYRSK